MRPFAINPRSFILGVAVLPGGNPQHANTILAKLPAAWSAATQGRSAITLTGDPAELDIIVIVSGDRSREPDVEARFVARTILLFALPEDIDDPDTQLVRLVMHEIGHVLGCCRGPGTAGSHFIGCPPRQGDELMCPRSLTMTFSERELAQMGLAAR